MTCQEQLMSPSKQGREWQVKTLISLKNTEDCKVLKENTSRSSLMPEEILITLSMDTKLCKGKVV